MHTFLLWVALVAFFLRGPLFLLLAGACLAIALIRMFSRDRNARQREDDMFRNFFTRMKLRRTAQRAQKVRPVKASYASQPGESTLGKEKKKKKKKEKKKDAKPAPDPAPDPAAASSAAPPVSVIVACPHCQQELRVPAGKGKLMITCKKCGEKFEKTT